MVVVVDVVVIVSNNVEFGIVDTCCCCCCCCIDGVMIVDGVVEHWPGDGNDKVGLISETVGIGIFIRFDGCIDDILVVVVVVDIVSGVGIAAVIIAGSVDG